jgi:hypothetical protein
MNHGIFSWYPFWFNIGASYPGIDPSPHQDPWNPAPIIDGGQPDLATRDQYGSASQTVLKNCEIYETFKTTSQILTSKPRVCQPPHLIKYCTILYRLSSTLFEFQSSPSSSSLSLSLMPLSSVPLQMFTSQELLSQCRTISLPPGDSTGGLKL